MWLELLKSSLERNFRDKLKENISRLGKNIKEFSEECGVPSSTLYKIISEEEKDFRMSTFKLIIKTVKRLEGYEREAVIGIITTRGALDTLGGSVEVGGEKIKVNEYSATTIEEEIIQVYGLRRKARRD